MRELTRYRSVIHLITWAILAGSLSACNPPGSDDAKNSSQAVGLPLTNGAACETYLRTQMETKALLFQQGQQASDVIDMAKAALPKLQKVGYEIGQVDGKNKTLKIIHTSIIQDTFEGLQYELSSLNDNKDYFLSLKIEFAHKEATRFLNLRQDFNVDRSCQLHWSKTKDERIHPIASSSFDYITEVFYVDGGRDSKKERFDLPENRQLIQLSPVDFYDMDFYRAGGLEYDQGLGLLSLELKSESTAREKFLDLELEEQIQNFQLFVSGQSLMPVTYGIDKKTDIRFLEFNGTKQWSVGRALWWNQFLGQETPDASLIAVNVPSDYLYSNWNFQLVAGSLLSYDHLSAYFSTNLLGTDSKTGKSVFLMTEKGTPTIEDKATEKDLELNDTLQGNHPKIQAWAKSIRELEPSESDRRKRIERILKFLKAEYSYDYDMLNNNVVRPLTVTEALANMKGVCQHYAVIFTTLARTLGIPSRIVVGYHIGGGSAVAHAWVEAEVEPGLWQVIEPQNENGLAATRTRFYLPAARALFLEDRNNPDLEANLTIIGMSLEVRPKDATW